MSLRIFSGPRGLGLVFAKALKLPIFKIESMKLIKRVIVVISNGGIEKVFYPVFPPDKNGEEVLKWFMQEGLSFVAGTPKIFRLPGCGFIALNSVLSH